ncbi:hypothetical protein FGB62_225g02 [Gracilaria domingensis]|nr:hypothetical protein FGB62_225g02 [Gracilaria domingensis]
MSHVCFLMMVSAISFCLANGKNAGHAPKAIQIPSSLLQSSKGDLGSLLHSAARASAGAEVLRLMRSAHESDSGMTQSFQHNGMKIICARMEHSETDQGKTLCVAEHNMRHAERNWVPCDCAVVTATPTATPTRSPTPSPKIRPVPTPTIDFPFCEDETLFICDPAMGFQ